MKKTILIIAENKDVRQLIERKIQDEVKYLSIKSSSVETFIETVNEKIVVIEKDNSYNHYIYDEIKTITKDIAVDEIITQKVNDFASELLGTTVSDEIAVKSNGEMKIKGATLSAVENEIDFIVFAYERALKAIDEAIEQMQIIQKQKDYDSIVYHDSLESQLSLEKTKLELIRNLENTKWKTF